MKPTVQMQDVEKEVDQSNYASPSLKRVATITCEPVLTAVDFSGLRNPNPDDCVKD
jgi:hypothetical protein